MLSRLRIVIRVQVVDFAIVRIKAEEELVHCLNTTKDKPQEQDNDSQRNTINCE